MTTSVHHGGQECEVVVIADPLAGKRRRVGTTIQQCMPRAMVVANNACLALHFAAFHLAVVQTKSMCSSFSLGT